MTYMSSSTQPPNSCLGTKAGYIYWTNWQFITGNHRGPQQLIVQLSYCGVIHTLARYLDRRTLTHAALQHSKRGLLVGYDMSSFKFKLFHSVNSKTKTVYSLSCRWKKKTMGRKRGAGKKPSLYATRPRHWDPVFTATLLPASAPLVVTSPTRNWTNELTTNAESFTGATGRQRCAKTQLVPPNTAAAWRNHTQEGPHRAAETDTRQTMRELLATAQ